MKRSLVALTAAAVLGAATPAMAESLSIPYHDLNLATEKGQATLDRRIDTAVREQRLPPRNMTADAVERLSRMEW